MDKLNILMSLNEARKSIDDLIEKVKDVEEEDDSRRLLIIALSMIGALVVICAVAYAVYRHFSEDYLDDYEDLDDVFEDEDDDEDEDEDEDDDEDDEDDDAEEGIYDDDFQE